MSEASPIGSSVEDDINQQAAESREFQTELERFQPYEDVARAVILYRTRHGITQEELARRVGTTRSAISRLESGQHAPNVETLRRIARALGGYLVIRFDLPPNDAKPARQGAVAS
jgi:DNA-binding XRE family transcriptional regulator